VAKRLGEPLLLRRVYQPPLPIVPLLDQLL
jgi:hypothetical protein